MALALIVLAVGSIAAGYAGFPRALGGSNRFERFLEPSFTVRQGDVPSAGLQADVEGAETATEGLEVGLMAVSTVVALGGIRTRLLLFLKNPRAADDVANRFAGLHRVLVNKYTSRNLRRDDRAADSRLSRRTGSGRASTSV